MTVCDDVQIKYTGDDSAVLYTFPFEYMEQSDVKVGFLSDTTNEYVEVAQDDANHPWSFENATTIRFTTAPTSSEQFKIYRNTTIDYAVFSPGSSIRAQDLNDNFDQIELAIEEGRCGDEDVKDFVEENFWDKRRESGDTIYSNDQWLSQDTSIATTFASDQRYLKLIGPDANITTEADQIAGTVPDDDIHVLSNAASIERHDNIVGPTNPGDQSQDGKLWIDSSTERIQYWNDDINAWVDTSQSGPQGPEGPQGPSGTIAVGTTTTSAPGGDAEVTNSGTDTAAIFNFTIPRGETGPQGPQGEEGPVGAGIQFRGQLDATLPNSAPADAQPGDLWFNTGDGVVDASWGAPAAGTDVDTGWRLALTTDNTWEALEPAAPASDLWEVDAAGVLVPIDVRAVSVPAELFIGGSTTVPTLRIDPDDTTAGTGLFLAAESPDAIGVKTNATVRAVFSADGLTVGDAIDLNSTTESISVGNTAISSGLINNVGTLNVGVNGDVILRADQLDVVTPAPEFSVEGTPAAGFAVNLVEGSVYRVDAVNGGDEADWATFGAPNPQPGQYFQATRNGTLPANNNATEILTTADLNVSGAVSIGEGLTVNNITFQDGTTINTGGAGATVTVSDTPPADPEEGDLWWDSVQGEMFLWFDDGTSAQWVQANGVSDALWQRDTGVVNLVTGTDDVQIQSLATEFGGPVFATPDGTLTRVEPVAPNPIEPDGGNISDDTVAADGNTYQYIWFDTAGDHSIEFRNEETNIAILCVGGGGGCGGISTESATSSVGGGAGGGITFAQNCTIPAGTYNITVGRGGLAGNDTNKGNTTKWGQGGTGSSFDAGGALELYAGPGGGGYGVIGVGEATADNATGEQNELGQAYWNTGGIGLNTNGNANAPGPNARVAPALPANETDRLGAGSTIQYFGGSTGRHGFTGGGANYNQSGGGGGGCLGSNANASDNAGVPGETINSMAPDGTTRTWGGGGSSNGSTLPANPTCTTPYRVAGSLGGGGTSCGRDWTVDMPNQATLDTWQIPPTDTTGATPNSGGGGGANIAKNDGCNGGANTSDNASARSGQGAAGIVIIRRPV